MLPDRVSNPGPLTYESGALPIALRGPETSPEDKRLHPTSSRRQMCTSSVSYVIYHKFSHGDAFYTPNGKNINVMLEYAIAISCVAPATIRRHDVTTS